MPKAMIFLFDGTANDATEDRFSNVYAINQLIADRKTVRSGGASRIKTQITFYLPGVGTKFTVRRKKKKILDFGIETGEQYIFGDGVEQLILRAYVNLSANYHPGDEIVIIGFSRGAAAARIFSRLISDFGILSSDMLLHLDQLWNEFVVISKEDHTKYDNLIKILQGQLAEKANKPVFHQPKGMPIKFLGVFDTVSGHFDNDVMQNVDFRDAYPAKGVEHIVHLLSMHETRWEFPLKRFEIVQSQKPTFETLREIWVPGVHSDIGGGYEENLISNICLLTMCDALEKLGGIAIDRSAYAKIESEIKTKVQNARLVINSERTIKLPKRKRDPDIAVQDDIHPLHWYLLNKSVIWKKDKPPTIYVDRLGRTQQVKDAALERQFLRWVSGKSPGNAKPTRTAKPPRKKPVRKAGRPRRRTS